MYFISLFRSCCKWQDKPVAEKSQTEEERSQHQEMAQLKAEVNSLWEEYKAQLDTRARQQEGEGVLKQQLDQLFEKRDALKKDRVRSAVSPAHIHRYAIATRQTYRVAYGCLPEATHSGVQVQ